MEARVEYYADINGTATVFNSTIHDTDEEYEFIEWTPQVNIFKKQFLSLNLVVLTMKLELYIGDLSSIVCKDAYTL